MEDMNGLPTISEDYQVQLSHNNKQAEGLFSALFPEINPTVIFETLNIVGYLQETKVNPLILPRVIRGIHNVMIGTGKGQVVIHVQGTMTNVSIRETDEELKTRV